MWEEGKSVSGNHNNREQQNASTDGSYMSTFSDSMHGCTETDGESNIIDFLMFVVLISFLYLWLVMSI